MVHKINLDWKLCKKILTVSGCNMKQIKKDDESIKITWDLSHIIPSFHVTNKKNLSIYKQLFHSLLTSDKRLLAYKKKLKVGGLYDL